MSKDKTYIAIDLKSFYASVECVDRGMDPLTAHLVVADSSRTEKTICLAVSPSLKAYGISGRARLFEVVQRVKEVNAERKRLAPNHTFTGEGYDDTEVKENPALSLAYHVAPPRMAHYMAVSSQIYQIYLQYVAPEDIHVYSIDEVFIDATDYIEVLKITAREFAMKMIGEVLRQTGITATAGIAPNLYLCKVAMDIVAKHIPPDRDGVRIAELDEKSYRRLLWNHRPITDFWRVGAGYAKKLEEYGIYTMGDVARCSLGKETDYYNEDLLYRLIGVNAELLIDHAWGYEPCAIADIKAYKPSANSMGAGQVLHSPYPFDKAKLVVREMTDLLALDLVEKGLATDQIILTVGYDAENLKQGDGKVSYRGEVTIDRYGRKIPKHARGTANLGKYSSSSKALTDAVMALFDRIVDRRLLVRRINLTANRVEEETRHGGVTAEQLDLFTDAQASETERNLEKAALEKEKRAQCAMLDIKKKFGKNAIVKGMNLEEGATAIDRNRQIGGHKA